MANELRQRQVGIGGLVEDAPLTNVATTLTSAGLVAVTGGVDSSHHLAITLDPDGVAGNPEIVYVTALTGGTGSATIARGKEGSTARQHTQDTPWVHAPTDRDFDGVGAGVIAHVGYDGATSDVDVATTSTSFADVDATNIKVTFTAPPSGKVIVDLNAWAAGATSTTLYWNLRDGGGDVSNTSVAAAAGALSVRALARISVTGLTAGTSYTYKWGHKSSTGTSVATGYGTTKGKATMTVTAVNT